MRRSIIILFLSLAVASCGDALGGVGELSKQIVHGSVESTTTTRPPTQSPSLRLRGITGTIWSNDDLGTATANLSREQLITAIWLRGDKVNPFVQASRREIADALPGIEFPQLVPDAVTHISSQMLYDQLTGTLSATTTAAFGLWVGEPYDLPRNEGQLAVLRVGMKTIDDDTDGDIFSFQVTGGRELAWTDGDYVYQLFCRTGVSEAACFEMADSTVPLSLLVNLP